MLQYWGNSQLCSDKNYILSKQRKMPSLFNHGITWWMMIVIDVYLSPKFIHVMNTWLHMNLWLLFAKIENALVFLNGVEFSIYIRNVHFQLFVKHECSLVLAMPTNNCLHIGQTSFKYIHVLHVTCEKKVCIFTTLDRPEKFKV